MLKNLILGTAMLFSVSAFAQDHTPAAVSDPKAQSPVAQQLSMANQLVVYGYQTKNALPLIQAVQIYKDLNVREAQDVAPKETSGTPITSPSLTKTDVISYDVKQILADATNFANGNKNLLALIKDTEKKTQGLVDGPKTITDRVEPNTTDTWKFRFRGGEDAIVIVSGDGDTDLDLYIYDENMNLIDSDTDSTDQCVCTFKPKWTGYFYVRIKNLGNVYNRYTMIIN